VACIRQATTLPPKKRNGMKHAAAANDKRKNKRKPKAK